MNDLADGESAQVKGSGSSIYTLKNSGGVYSCTCPAWMHQSIGIEQRTCKHLRAYRGDEAEKARLGSAELSGKPARKPTVNAAGVLTTSDPDEEGPPLLLAHKWENDVDLSGWWLSEKLDGVRAYWDGSQFISRLGNKFHAPDWFVDGLPKTPLDGELWGGRKLFQRTVGIVKRQDKSPLWKELLYVVFDAPAHPGTFEERIAHCETLVGDGKHTYARVHAQSVCNSVDHLREELARVEGLGGEGLMARRPKSQYEAGRSSSLLKVKTFHDAEARVVGHAPGAGKHKGRLGALVVELADRTRFNVGTGFSDAEREDPPAIGALITFRYQELSDAGVPRFPTYVGVRIDGSGPSTLGEAKAKPAISGKAGMSSANGASAAKPPRAPTPDASDGDAPAAKTTAPRPGKAFGTSGNVRRFEMTDGETRYFWEIEHDGAKHRVRYGTFELKTKSFGDEDDAASALETRIAEKLANGFTEVG